MNKNTLIVVGIVVLVAAVAWMKNGTPTKEPVSVADSVSAVSPEASPASTSSSQPAKQLLPRVVDLGAEKCVACKMLAPILEELKREYAGKAIVEFIDVWKNPDAGREYGIRVIPTQIFYDRQGREAWRNEGFLKKEIFVEKLHELGAR